MDVRGKDGCKREGWTQEGNVSRGGLAWPQSSHWTWLSLPCVCHTFELLVLLFHFVHDGHLVLSKIGWRAELPCSHWEECQHGLRTSEGEGGKTKERYTEEDGEHPQTHVFVVAVRTVLMKASSHIVVSISEQVHHTITMSVLTLKHTSPSYTHSPLLHSPLLHTHTHTSSLEMWRDCATTNTNTRFSSSDSVDRSWRRRRRRRGQKEEEEEGEERGGGGGRRKGGRRGEEERGRGEGEGGEGGGRGGRRRKKDNKAKGFCSIDSCSRVWGRLQTVLPVG